MLLKDVSKLLNEGLDIYEIENILNSGATLSEIAEDENVESEDLENIMLRGF